MKDDFSGRERRKKKKEMEIDCKIEKTLG